MNLNALEQMEADFGFDDAADIVFFHCKQRFVDFGIQRAPREHAEHSALQRGRAFGMFQRQILAFMRLALR